MFPGSDEDDAKAIAHAKEQQQRADVLAIAHISESSKFDYFILTISLAVCGYLAQTNQYGRFDVNRETFQLGVLAIFVLSAMFGAWAQSYKLKNTSGIVRAIQHSHTETALDKHDKAIDQFVKYRRLRGLSIWLLIIGIPAYAAVRVLASYHCQGCMPRLPV
ncbi:hypothetical protein ABQX22_00540 [Xanthomonas sp. WHRI 1810A]|jgi:hypothetical protein|uniref:hypothetical protein n=1 Tax=Xanthomonas sp. WHRI 1810A TaxID=3161565 RepID=UPI0032E8C6F6